MRIFFISTLIFLTAATQVNAQNGELAELIAALQVLSASEPDWAFEDPPTLKGVIAGLMLLAGIAPTPVEESEESDPDQEAEAAEDSEPPELPEQFNAGSLIGTYYDAYYDGTRWRYDVLTFSESDEACENPHAQECGTLSAEGQYTYETVWELWSEPEGMLLSWDIPGLGRQWLAICHRAEDHCQMLWKISKGDLVIALREYQCGEEYFFFSEQDAAAFVSSQPSS